MIKLKKIILHFFFVMLFSMNFFCIVTAQIRNLDFEKPFRLKNLHAFQTSDGLGEIWSVGGYGSLVVNTSNNRIEKKISDNDLNAIFFVDNETAFVVGNSGELLITKNRGKNWQKIELNTKVNLQSIFCLNKNDCRIVGDSEGLLITGGIAKKWQIENIVSGGELEDVFFVSEKVGFVVGRNSLLLKTDDGGKNWQRISLNYKTEVSQFIEGIFRFESVSFFNGKIGCVTGWGVGSGIIACTQDTGNKWKINLIDGTFGGVVWKSKNKVYLINENGKNYVSNNAGLSWKKE